MASRGRIEPEDAGIGDLFSQLIDDARGLARAEIELGKQLVVGRIRRAGMGIGLAVGAVMLLQAAVTALLVGLVIALAASVGPLIATLIVFVCALIVIAGVALAAKASITAAVAGSEDKAG